MQVQEALRALTQSGEKQQTPLSGELLSVILKGLALVSRHYQRDLDELQTETYIQGLRNLKPAKIAGAFTLALERLKRMPLIADLRELADEVELPEEQSSREYEGEDTAPSPVLREVQNIMDEIAVERYGKPRHEMNDRERFECAAEAAKIHYQRMKRRAW